MDAQVILNGLIASAAYALLAFAFVLVYQINKFFDLTPAVGAVVGAYTTLLITTALHWSMIGASVLAVAVAALLGILLDFSVLRPMDRMRSAPSEKFLATLGLVIVIQSVIAVSFGDDTKVFTGPNSNSLEAFGLSITRSQLAIVLAAALVPLFGIVAERSYFGRFYRAVVGDEELARVVGIRVNSVRVAASALSLAVAALAGVLIGADVGLTPGMGFRAILMGVVAAIIGGIGSFRGIIPGALFIGVTQNLIAWWISTAWQDAATFCLLIIFLIVRPQGLLGKLLRRTSV